MRLVLLGFSLIALVLPASASGAEYTVTTSVDTLNEEGCTAQLCTLRDAISAANDDGNDVIIVPAGTYSLQLEGRGEDENATGDLDVLGSQVEIRGAGARSTLIDASGLDDEPDRVIDVVGAAGVTISGLTVTGGLVTDGSDGGGGIRLLASVATLEEVAIRANGSTVVGSGYGRGGGLLIAGGFAAVERATVSGNTATGDGGGVFVDGTAAATLTNSTIAGNRVDTTFGPGAPEFYAAIGGGIEVGDGGELDLQGVTVARNVLFDPQDEYLGTGIAFWDSDVSASQTLVAANTARVEAVACPTPLAGDHNLADDDSCFASEGNVLSEDPQLGALGGHGGPTDTIPLLEGSPAIDVAPGEPSLDTDQRGVARPQGDGPGDLDHDIGAYEFRPEADLSITVTAPDSAVAGQEFTWQASVSNEANTTAGASGVTVAHTLPAGVTLISAAAGQGTCTGTSTVTCSLGTISDGSGVGIVFRVRAAGPGWVVNSATVSAAEPDLDGTDNSGAASTNVTPAVPPGKVAPAGLTLRTTPKRDRSAPFRFRARGRLRLPANVTVCSGRVALRVKRGSTTVARRKLSLRSSCRYGKRIRIKAGRLGRRGKLRVRARFTGNDALSAISSKRRTVRYGPS